MVYIQIIHYTKLKERKLFQESQLKDFQLNFIEEYDKEELKNVNLEKLYKFDKNNLRNKTALWKNNNDNFYKLTDGEISCELKHIQALKNLAESEYDYGLILEDDAVFYKENIDHSLIEFFKKVDSLTFNWDAIFIGDGMGQSFINSKLNETNSLNNGFVKVSHPATNCAEAYIIKRSAAKKILETILPFNLAYDWELAYQFYVNNLDVYWFLPHLFTQGSKTGKFNSTVRNYKIENKEFQKNINDHINLLYCFDENYNKQALLSLTSILENTKTKINFHIIHKNPETLLVEFEQLINKYVNLNSIEIHEFNKEGVYFPKLNKSHVSEATYYRIFINKYLNSEVKFYLYLDADIVCINSFEKEYFEYCNNLNASSFTIGAVVEKNKKTIVNEDTFERLMLNGDFYFNAGVMLINYHNWIEFDITSKLIELLEEYKERIVFWDQDVLNVCFDGSFLHLDSNLNFLIKKNENQVINKNIQLLHFAGSFKPWSIRGIMDPSSYQYQDLHIKYFNKYLLKKENITTFIILFFQGVFSGNILKVKHPYLFIKALVNLIFKNEN